MIQIMEQDGVVTHYKCDCGAKGILFIKPLEKDGAAVIVISCPSCGETERITLVQYSSEENKDALINKINDLELSWCPIFNEET